MAQGRVIEFVHGQFSSVENGKSPVQAPEGPFPLNELTHDIRLFQGTPKCDVGYVSVNLGGCDACMPKEPLHKANIDTAFQQERGSGMAQHVWRNSPGYVELTA
jgi:hypothetical protein